MIYLKSTLLLLLSVCFFINVSPAQTEDDNVKNAVLAAENVFWTGYNTCNYDQMGGFISEDVEFYHDKGGITLGKTALVESVKKNLCSNPNFRTRREAVPETVKVFLLKNSNRIYGAIVSGEHYFYNSYDGKPEKREGLAKFTTLWTLKENAWRMSRVLSYDHGPALYENKRQAKKLSESELNRFSGQYVGAKSKILNVNAEKDVLILIVENSKYTLYPETDNLFFVKDRDLTFEFVAEKGKVTKMVVRENGNTVEEAQIKK